MRSGALHTLFCWSFYWNSVRFPVNPPSCLCADKHKSHCWISLLNLISGHFSIRLRQAKKWVSGSPAPQPVLEQELRLSAASGGQKIAVAALAVVNFMAIQTLAGLLASPANVHTLAASGFGWVGSLLPFLRVYALSFFVIPTVRGLSNARANAGIRARNAARRDATARLATPDPALAAKLATARAEARLVRFDPKRVIYDSGASPAAAERTSDQDLLSDWESRFQERTRGGVAGRGAGAANRAPRTDRRTEEDRARPPWLHWREDS